MPLSHLRSSPYLQPVVQHLSEDLLTAFAGGAALAFVFHSSVAAILMLAAFCAQGLLPLDAGLPLVLGANAGSGLIAVWLARNLHSKARRIAVGNLVVRVLGGIAALILLRHFTLPLDAVAGYPGTSACQFPSVVQCRAACCLPAVRHTAGCADPAPGCGRR